MNKPPPQTRRRKKAHAFGHWAEIVAAALLVAKGYSILARRYHVKGGEVDLIARRGDTIAFVEVKARRTLDEARISIDTTKRQRISRAAAHWISMARPHAQANFRGDAIFIAPWKWPDHVLGAVDLDIF